MTQHHTPFLDSLLAEKHTERAAFHMPGHKRVLSPLPALLDFWGGDLYPADLVEINGEIDYLHAPRGALKEAQELAAQAYGADQTFFLINGSTVGNLAALMATVSDGEKVIMPRASHRSVYSGVALSGALPVYVEPEYHPQIGFPLAVRIETLQQLLAAHPDAKAVHLTAPNYYGVLSDIAHSAALAHEYGTTLLVDAAHGAHLGFHERLPTSALQLGADIVVQSTHKTLGALTQASLLHVKGERVSLARLTQLLALLQSSSPSAILLASLDAARMQMATQGRALLDNALRLAQQAREQIRRINGLWCYGDELIGAHGIAAYDPTKLIIRVTDLGMSGFEAYQALHTRCGVDAEFADLRQIVCSITIADSESSVARLVEALSGLAAEPRAAQAADFTLESPPGLPTQALSPRAAYFAPSKAVPIADSVGEICAENLIPYPPGIPLLVPGEVIDAARLDYLRYLLSRGSRMVGPEDPTLATVRVVAR